MSKLVAKAFPLMQRAVEEGVSYGYNRAFKHTDTPAEEDLKTAIEEAVINSICEWFDFEGTNQETK